jgi:centractin
MADGNQPLVIDNGSGVIKAGFAGAEKPRVILRSCVGRLKHPDARVIPGGAFDKVDVLVGPKIDEHRGVLRIEYPMENGVVTNWSDMEKIWTYLYSKENLNVKGEDHAVLLTEAPLNPYAHREKAAEIFFESLNVPALHCSIQAILSLFASGRTTGVVLDSGDGVTHVVPVYEGVAITHGISRMDVAGRAVTQQLQRLLRRHTGYTFHTSSEMEVVREIKEACCSVSPTGGSNSSSSSAHHSSAAAASSSSDSNAVRTPYRLPDGTVLEIGAEPLQQAAEILFQPELVGYEYRGVQECLVGSVMRCDVDLRRRLLGSIVLAGGSTLFPGYGERLLFELRRHPFAPKEAKLRIAAPPERMMSCWVGGSILASLATFKTLWVSKAEYLEHGARLLSNRGGL